MSAPPTHLVDPPPALPRRRRQAAVPQAAIARAIRAAREHAGPNWCVEIEVEGSIVRVYQGDAPVTTPVAPDKAWRL
jgi:hypothetical protein